MNGFADIPRTVSLLGRVPGMKYWILRNLPSLIQTRLDPGKIFRNTGEPQGDPFDEPAQDDSGIAVYLHIPFCTSFCRHCIFNKSSRLEYLDQYLNALVREMEIVTSRQALRGRKIHSVHIGGGTPSLLTVEQMARLLNNLSAYFDCSMDPQITVECNPDSLSPEKARGYADAGISRFSLGIQSLTPRILTRLGRTHDPDSSVALLEQLSGISEQISVDLMFGLEHQTPSDFICDISRLLSSNVTHFSLFPLVPSGGSWKNSTSGAFPESRNRREMYYQAVRVLENAGYSQYSAEDFSLNSGSWSQYQVDVWAFPRRELLSIGTGGFSSIQSATVLGETDLQVYLDRINQGELPYRIVRMNRPEEGPLRDFLFGLNYLRIDKDQFREMYNREPAAFFPRLLGFLRHLSLLQDRGNYLELTLPGKYLIAEVWSALVLAFVSH